VKTLLERLIFRMIDETATTCSAPLDRDQQFGQCALGDIRRRVLKLGSGPTNGLAIGTDRNEIDRRKFLQLSGLAAGSVLADASAHAFVRIEPVAPALPSLSARPKEKPLDWKARADAFDTYVMDPSNKVYRTRPDGTKYFASALEGIGDGGLTTFAPLALGKILRGDAVDDLLPSMAAFFSDEAGIFLDGIHADLCEYWYLMNVNALAEGVIRLRLANDPAWTGRVKRSADRLIDLAHQISYDFNDQGYRFNTRVPFTNKDIYRQPDTIGGYAYVQLLAYEMLGEQRYLDEAIKALKLYQAFPKNPWYEIPSGAMASLAAARLSVSEAAIDMHKVLSFALATGGHPMQTGEWGGKEVNGLMAGFSTEPEGQAYSMESLMPLPYLLPMLRYRPEFATEVGRYFLNTAANMRLFYADCVPRENQSRPDLTAAVPYERLTQEVDGHSPYASGDYDSHRSIYGGAYALIWGELVKPTEDEFILQMNLSRTDFLAAKSFPTYLYYNPYTQAKQITLKLESGNFDLYDLTAHKFIYEKQTGSVTLTLPASAGRVFVVIPSSAQRKTHKNAMLCDGITVDYARHG
jgi:hypothetical protein